MPELPEVETIRKALEKQITNKKIIDFHIGNKKLRFDLPEKFKQLVIGQTVMKPLRVGKFCLLPLCSGKNILIHLGMSGKIKITTSKKNLIFMIMLLLNLMMALSLFTMIKGDLDFLI